MDEHPSMIVTQKIFDDLINSQVALYKQIKAKEGIETETITQEEADFANAFIVYAKELTKVAKSQL